MTIPENLYERFKNKGYTGLNDYHQICDWLESRHEVFVYVKPFNNEFQQVPKFMWVVENLGGVRGVRTSYHIDGEENYTVSNEARLKGLEFALENELK